MHKVWYNGMCIEIDIFKKANERTNQDQNPKPMFTNLFVSQLDAGMNRDDLRNMFSQFGEIDSCTMKNDTECVGYVSFKKTEDAQRALAEMNKTTTPGGNVLFVQRFIYKQDNNVTDKSGANLTPIAMNMKKQYENNIFVKNISLEVTEDQIREKFGSTGTIINLRLFRKPQHSH